MPQMRRNKPTRRRAESGRTRPAPTQRRARTSNYAAANGVRLGDLRPSDSQMRLQKSYAGYVRKIVVIAVILAALFALGFGLYCSPLFTIEKVTVKGSTHMTDQEMTALAKVPAQSTLLRVDTGAIQRRVMTNPWVKSVTINRIFPHTLELSLTERSIEAVVSVPTDQGKTNADWAISEDGVWLSYIPPRDSAEGQKTATGVYTDSEKALKITGVPYGVAPQVGTHCTDDSILSALKVLKGLSTSLKDQIKTISAQGADSVSLVLDNGIEVMVGNSENLREKERIALRLIQDNPGKIAYINVRTVDRPTWRAANK